MKSKKKKTNVNLGINQNESKSEEIKLADFEKNDVMQVEITFNIFDNLKDEDVKRLFSNEIDDEE